MKSELTESPQTTLTESPNPGATRPRADWIALPLISLFVAAAIFAVVHSIANKLYGTQTPETGCLVMNDPSTGVRGVPNSSCWKKAPESPWTKYSFNSCGDRASMDCGPKPPGKFRIVLMGSSYGFGLCVPLEKSFSALLPGKLSNITGKNIELYNTAMIWSFARVVGLRMNHALAAYPDLLLWDLTPMDVQLSAQVLPPDAPETALDRMRAAFQTQPPLDALNTVFGKFVRAATGPLLLQHLVYTSRSTYIQSVLMGKDADIGFLRTKYSSDWAASLRTFEGDMKSVADKARSAGVPLVVVFLPNRILAAMISNGEWPRGFDPYKLDRDVRSIVEKYGATYVDVLPDMRTVSHPEQYYYPIDSHPDAQGHAMLTDMIAKELTSNPSIPALKPSEGTVQHP